MQVTVQQSPGSTGIAVGYDSAAKRVLLRQRPDRPVLQVGAVVTVPEGSGTIVGDWDYLDKTLQASPSPVAQTVRAALLAPGRVRLTDGTEATFNMSSEAALQDVPFGPDVPVVIDRLVEDSLGRGLIAEGVRWDVQDEERMAYLLQERSWAAISRWRKSLHSRKRRKLEPWLWKHLESEPADWNEVAALAPPSRWNVSALDSVINYLSDLGDHQLLGSIQWLHQNEGTRLGAKRMSFTALEKALRAEPSLQDALARFDQQIEEAQGRVVTDSLPRIPDFDALEASLGTLPSDLKAAWAQLDLKRTQLNRQEADRIAFITDPGVLAISAYVSASLAMDGQRLKSHGALAEALNAWQQDDSLPLPLLVFAQNPFEGEDPLYLALDLSAHSGRILGIHTGEQFSNHAAVRGFWILADSFAKLASVPDHRLTSFLP